LWVVQPAIQNFFKKILWTRKVFKKKFCIAGCTTRNVFKKSFILWVVQPVMWKVQNM